MGNNIWNDPEWDKLRRRVNTRVPSRPPQIQQKNSGLPQKTPNVNQGKLGTKTSTETDTARKVQFSINLSLPKIKQPNVSKKHLKVGLASAVILGASVLGSMAILNRDKAPTDTQEVLSEASQAPVFDTVLPDGRQEETTSGKVGYDPQRKVASFTDKIGTASITVSQQELPDRLKENPDDEVKKIAEGFSVTEVINESNPKAYLGNDVAGPQTVIFHKNGILIFILSDKPIEKDLWAEYITKLL